MNVILQGTTIFLNSDMVREINERSPLHDFHGVVILCLGMRHLIDAHAIAVEEVKEFQRELRTMGLIPLHCTVQHVALGCNRSGNAGLMVNYTE